jgi:sulfur-oxidizing protein SoxY
MNRRACLKAFAAAGFMLLMVPLRALAAVWNRVAFESTHVNGALQGLGIRAVMPTHDATLIAPDMAENGAIVQIEVESHLAGTESISVIAEKNPTPLIAHFVFAEGTVPYVVTRIKMAETAELKAIIKAGGKYYSVAKRVEVALGGCG